MTKNKCTLAPFLFNTLSLFALLIKFLIDPLFTYNCPIAQRVFEYSAGSAACLFYLTAILVQIYEWDIISFQIQFQSKLSLQELDVQKTRFRDRERSRLSCFKCCILLNAIWHVIKMSMPVILVKICSDENEPVCSNAPCSKKTENMLDILMLTDCLLSVVVTSWAVYVSF